MTDAFARLCGAACRRTQAADIGCVAVARPRWSLRAQWVLSGRVAGLDTSGLDALPEGKKARELPPASPMLRLAAGRDPATARLDEYADLLISAFGVMFFGDRGGECVHQYARRAAASDARVWRSSVLAHAGRKSGQGMEVPMAAAAQHLPPRPKAAPNAPGMFAFADRDHVTEVLTAAGWTPPRFEKLDMDLDGSPERPGAGGGCDSVDPNRRREQLAAQPAS